MATRAPAENSEEVSIKVIARGARAKNFRSRPFLTSRWANRASTTVRRSFSSEI